MSKHCVLRGTSFSFLLLLLLFISPVLYSHHQPLGIRWGVILFLLPLSPFDTYYFFLFLSFDSLSLKFLGNIPLGPWRLIFDMNNIFSISYIVVWWLVPVYLFLENKLSLIRREGKARWDGENVSVHWEQLRLCGIDQIFSWHDALKGWGESWWCDVVLQLDFRVGEPAERSRASGGAEKKKLQESSST